MQILITYNAELLFGINPFRYLPHFTYWSNSRSMVLKSVELTDTKEWLITQKKWITPLAKKQSISRNSLDCLRDKGMWLEFDQVLCMREKLINVFYDIVYNITFDKVVLTSKLAYESRNIVMVLLFTLGLPLRSQNLIIKITNKKQLSFEATENCYVMEGENTFIEYVSFKNQSYMGYQVIPVTTTMRDILDQYLNVIWPFFSPNNKNNNHESYLGGYLFPSLGGGIPCKIGKCFASIFKKYSGVYVTPGTLRKIVETSFSSSLIFTPSEREKLSLGLLHDYKTAQDYYVLPDTKKVHNTILQNYEKHCSHLLQSDTGLGFRV